MKPRFSDRGVESGRQFASVDDHEGAIGGDTTFAGGGAMGALMRTIDWTATPLGAVHDWPQSLRTTVSTCLSSRFPILVWWGPELVMLYNDAYMAIIAGKHPRAMGAPGRAVWPEIWEIIGPMLNGVLAHGEATWSEDQLLLLERHGYPEECYFTFSYSPIRDESGGVGGVFTAVTETTERVIGARRITTLRALAERTSTARSIDEAAASSIDVLDDNTADFPFVLLYLFDEAQSEARLAGAARGADAPSTGTGFPATDPRAWPIAEVARDGQPRRQRLIPNTRAGGSGSPGPREAIVLPVARPGQDRPFGTLVAGISPRLELNDGYMGFLNLVSGQVATALANARAHEEERRRAEALAEIDRAKTAFFSNISHEFRTPLTLMLGPVQEALADAGETGEDRSWLEMVNRNGLRLLRLVNNLLDFSRIEAGRADAAYVPTDLAEYTAELASSFRAAIERAELSLDVDAPSLPEVVYVDREMWEKIVLNLLSNAFKHTFEGGITIAVSARNGSAVVSISDTGVGIPAAQVGRVFERFHRVPNTRSRTHEGSGIGLALVQELVRLHGGTIGVTSVEGDGTTFTVSLPFGASHLPQDKLRSDGARARAGNVRPFLEEALGWLPEQRADVKTETDARATAASDNAAGVRCARILLADDNGDMRAYVSRLLRDQSWDVEAVADGHAALDSAMRAPPDLVLADVMMPRLDGFGLLRALRDNPATRGAPFILLSARAGEEARVEGLSAGADDYLVKPFPARELVARVGAHLALSRARAEAFAEVDEARAQLWRVLEQAPAAISVLRGPSLVFELTNPMYRRMIGDRDVIGHAFRDVFPETEPQGLIDTLNRVYRTGLPFVGRGVPVSFDRGKGVVEPGFFDFTSQPLLDNDGHVAGIVTVAVETTDEVAARRDAELARKEAEADRVRANDANRAKSEFLAAMSHELRTPLNAIGGYSQLISLGVHGPVTEEQRNALGRIERSQAHLLSLINDVLSFAKLEAGKVDYRMEVVALADVVDGVTTMIDVQVASKGLTLETQIPPNVRVRADREKLQQIMLNLLSNAIKFTDPPGLITVENVTRDGVPDDLVLLRVSDTGIGIPHDKQDAVFDPFVQVHRRLTHFTEGTGLGLAISRDLARGMGGELRARSIKGVGSSFTLTLPRA